MADRYLRSANVSSNLPYCTVAYSRKPQYASSSVTTCVPYNVLHNEELHDLYVLFAKYKYNDQVTQDEMGRTCSMRGEKRHAYRVLVENSEGKRPLGRPRRGWDDNIKIDLREI
jgi:hypothetical protein